MTQQLTPEQLQNFQKRREAKRQAQDLQLLAPKTTLPDATQGIPMEDSKMDILDMITPSFRRKLSNFNQREGWEEKFGFKAMSDNISEVAKLGLETLGVTTRAGGAMTGQGDIQDPDTNILNFARQPLRDWIDRGMKSKEEQAEVAKVKFAHGHYTDALDDNNPYKYILDPRRVDNGGFKALRQVSDVAFDIFGDLNVALGLVKGVVKGIGKTPLKGVGKESLNKEGFQLTPAQAMEEGKQQALLQSKETAYQANPYTSELSSKMKRENLSLIEDKVSSSGKSLGAEDLQEFAVDKGKIRGQAIGEAGEDVQRIASDLYKQGESVVTKPLYKQKLPSTTKQIKTLKPSKLVDEAGNPIMKEVITEEVTNNASKRIDKLLDNVGYKGGEVTQTTKIGENTINATLGFKKKIADANTMEELINVKRNIGNDIYKGNIDRMFEGDKNQIFLGKINSSLNESIEEAIRKQTPKAYREEYVKAYRSLNKQISRTMDIMKDPAKKLNLQKGFNPDKVIANIESIPPSNLEALKSSKTTRGLYDELQKGAFESLLLKSFSKDGFSPTLMRTAWEKLSKKPAFRNSMFPKELVRDMDNYLEGFSKTQKGDLKLLNPSGTAKAKQDMENAKTLLSGGKNLLKGLFSYHAAKHYYKSGKTINQSAVNLFSKGARGMDNVLSKAQIDKIAKASSFTDFIRSTTINKEDK